MKSDQSNTILLGIIATGVAALTALAFEKRYQQCAREGDFPDDDSSPSEGFDRIRQRANAAGRKIEHEASNLKDRLEDGYENLKEKAVGLKDRVSDGFERAGGHLKDGAARLKDGVKEAAEELKEGAKDATAEVKDGAKEAAEEAKRGLGASKI